MTFETGQQIQKRCFTITACLTSAVFLIVAFHNAVCISNDFYFLAASGDEILQYGSNLKNFFHQAKDAPVYYQQWLYAVYCSYLAKAGITGVIASNIIQPFALNVLLFWLCRLRKCSLTLSILIPSFCISLYNGFFVNVRPECITIILLTLQLIAGEKYQQTRKWQWLLLFPVIGILESNLHATMLPMHLIIMIPYFLPFWFGKFYPYQKSEFAIKDFWIPLLGLFLAACIHPYGPSIYVYLFDSFTNGYNQVVSMMEMTGGFRNVLGLEIIVVCVFISFIKKNPNSTTIYLCFGLMYASVMIVRNGMFVIIAVCYAISSVGELDYFSKKISEIRNSPAAYGKTKAEIDSINIRFQKIWIFLSAFASLILSIVAFGFMSVIAEDYQKVSFLDIHSPETKCDITNENSRAIISWLVENEPDKNAVILNFMDEGGYLEFNGFQNVYIDCRPEIWNSEKTSSVTYNKADSILDEYVKLFITEDALEYINEHPDIKKKYQYLFLTDEQLSDYLDYYNTSYIMGYKTQKVVSYASKHPEEFELVNQCSKKDSKENTVFLYRKIQK